jgi:hypothetical protein
VTDLARRSPARERDDDVAPMVLSLPVAAVAAAAWAAALGLVLVGVLVLVAWILASHSDTGIAQALQAAGMGWLVAHRAPVTLAAGSFGVLPLGFVLLPLWLTSRAGRWAARAARVEQAADAVLLVVGGALCYGLLAAIVAGASTTASVSVVPLHALAAATGLAMVGLGFGVVRESGLGPELLADVPESVVHVARAGAAAALALAGLGALLAAVSLALHLHEAASVQQSLGTGVVGGLLLTLLGAGYAPVAAVWAGSYAAGPGFVVGSGTRFSFLGTVTGDLPSFPWLAALPDAALRGGAVLLLLPVLAGVVGGVVLLRRLPAHTTTVLLGEVVGVAAVCGLLWGIAAALAGGGLGPGRLAFAGPVWWQVGLAVTGEALVGVLLVVLVDTARMRFHSRPNPA